MKKILFYFLIAIGTNTFAGTSPDSLNKKIAQLKDSLTKLKDADKKSAVYDALYKYYSALGDHYQSAYKDSAALCKDSIMAILTRAIKPKEDNKEEDTTRYNFRFKLYTDFVGFKGDQPNGLVQSELSFGWNIHKNTPWFLQYRKQKNKSANQYSIKKLRQYKNDTSGLVRAKAKDSLRDLRLFYREKNANCLTLFKNVVFPIVTLSKLKDSLRYKDLNYDSSAKIYHIHTFDLIKYSNFNVSGKLNLFTFQSRSKDIKIFLDLFGTFYSTGVNEKDTTLASGLRRHNVNSVGYGLNMKLQFDPPSNHFSMEASLSDFQLRLLNNDIMQQKGKQYYPESNPKNNTFYSGNTVDAVAVWTASIRYSTKTNQENKNNDGLFLRISFFNNITSGLIFGQKVGPLDYNNNFLQVQFGLSKNMNDLLKFLKP